MRKTIFCIFVIFLLFISFAYAIDNNQEEFSWHLVSWKHYSLFDIFKNFFNFGGHDYALFVSTCDQVCYDLNLEAKRECAETATGAIMMRSSKYCHKTFLSSGFQRFIPYCNESLEEKSMRGFDYCCCGKSVVER